MEFDSFYEEDMRVFGMGKFPGAGSADIAALSIQRGRDFGFPSYNDIRASLGLSPKLTFSDISADPAVSAKLGSLYGNVSQVDFFVGALAESHPGAHFSESMAAVFESQFMRTIKSDRLFYKSSSSGFTREEKRQLDKIRLKDLVLQHTGLDTMQCNAFFWKGKRDCNRDDDDVEYERAI
jgi:peroxidase